MLLPEPAPAITRVTALGDQIISNCSGLGEAPISVKQRCASVRTSGSANRERERTRGGWRLGLPKSQRQNRWKSFTVPLSAVELYTNHSSLSGANSGQRRFGATGRAIS